MARYYFIDEDSEVCYTKGHAIELAIEANPEAEFIHLFEANRMIGTDFFYCKYYHLPGEKNSMACGKHCVDYSPRNGVSGICNHNGYVYEPAKKIKIKIK